MSNVTEQFNFAILQPDYDRLAPQVDKILYHPYTALWAAILKIVRFLQDLPPFVTQFVAPIVLLYSTYHFVTYVLSEYQAFLDLGRGGTPSTPLGWVKAVTKKFFARVDVLSSPHVDPMLEPYRGRLSDLKRRPGQRPIVKGVTPQRQIDQKAPITTFDLLMRMLQDAASENKYLKVTTSFLEGHTKALKAIFPGQARKIWDTEGEWDYEIAHPHRVDGSWYCILHPEDVGTVVQQGWGERHPLATDAWWWKIFYHYIRLKRRPVPFNLVLVYAPRSPAEFRIARQILDAAIWYHEERYVHGMIEKGLMSRTDSGLVLNRN